MCIEDEIGKKKRKQALGIARKWIQEAKQKGNTTVNSKEGGEWRVAEDVNICFLILYAELSL